MLDENFARIILRMFTGFSLQTLPFILLSIYPVRENLRFGKKKTYIYTGLLFMVLNLLFTSLSTAMYYRSSDHSGIFTVINTIFMATISVYVVWFMFITRTMMRIKLFVMIYTLTGAVIITASENYIVNLFNPKDNDLNDLPYSGYTIPISALVAIVAVPFLIYLLHSKYVPRLPYLTVEENKFLLRLSTILFLIVLLSLSYMDYTLLKHKDMFLLFFSLIIAVLAVYSIAFALQNAYQDKSILRYNEIKLREQMKTQSLQYSLIKEKIDMWRARRHDIRHELLYLKTLIENENTSEALEYLDKRISKMDRDSLKTICADPTVNGILTYYYNQATSFGINPSFKADLDALRFVSHGDFSIILGNLLENAVTAASKCSSENRIINFSLLKKGNTIVIRIENTFNETIKRERDNFISTKSDNNGDHGIGIASIKQLASYYDGFCEFSFDNGVFRAVVSIEDIYPKYER